MDEAPAVCYAKASKMLCQGLISEASTAYRTVLHPSIPMKQYQAEYDRAHSLDLLINEHEARSGTMALSYFLA